MPDRDKPREPAGFPRGGARRLRKRAPSFPADLLDSSLLELLSQAERPLSAYNLVSLLREQGRQMAVMSIYRSLDRLCARGLIDRVEMLSAFRIRDVPKAALLICIDCGTTQPLAVSDLRDSLMRRVAYTGFSPGTVALEVAGLCPACGGRKEP
jgi:Fur family zinc uptake transcriptional regulator